MEACDLMNKLRNIRVPTFYLNALDDPFFGPHCIPIEECSYDNIMIGVTKTGGHACHF